MTFVKQRVRTTLPKHLELDLLLIDVLTLLLVITVLILPVPILREILGLLFVFLFPGYVLVAALFPRQEVLGTTTRTALSLGLSIAVGVLAGLILGLTPSGFTLNSILAALSLFTLIISCLAWYLRNRNDQRNSTVSKSLPFPASAIQVFRASGFWYRGLVVMLSLVVIVGLGSLTYALARPLPSKPSSEFYIVGSGGKAEGYPRVLRVGEAGKVSVVVISNEAQETSYRVQVRVDGRQLYEFSGIVLNPHEKWQKEAKIVLQEAGENQKVEFLLFRDTDVTYETRYIWVSVIE